MIERSIEYIRNLEGQQERERRIQECYGINQILIYKILEFPQMVYDKFIEFIDTRELGIKDAEDLVQEIVMWEWKVTDTIREYHFLKDCKKKLMYDNAPDDYKKIITQMVDEFQTRTRIAILSYTFDEDDPDDIRIKTLRDKYIKYLFDKYDSGRNRQTS